MATDDRNRTDERNARAYNRDFMPAVVGYVVSVVAITILIDFEDAGWWRFLAVLVPLAPAAWGVRAVGRHLRRIDELQRTIHLEAMALGFGVAMIVSLTIGFLDLARVPTDRWGPWVVYGAGMLAWGVHAARRSALV